MTFSLVARDPAGPLFGIVIASSSPAVAARCAHASAGVGAVATQNITNPALGPAVLSLLDRQNSTDAAVGAALAADPYADYRQILAIGVTGAAVIRSGDHVLGVHGEAVDKHAAAAGNLLASSDVPAAMVEGFAQARGRFGDRLLHALRAAQLAGGEAGPIHSAGLLIVRDLSWPLVDLRVDWTDGDPVAMLLAAWDVYAPQMEDYVQRAQNPAAAPNFNVPGDQPR